MCLHAVGKAKFGDDDFVGGESGRGWKKWNVFMTNFLQPILFT